MPAATSVATAKPRIPWDGDSAFAGGKTSIAVLLEWLSAPGNGERWRFGGVRLGGLDGGALEPHFSKIELAREVVSVMEAQGITHRMARDVRWKINALCRSYATAARFLAQFEQQKRSLLRDAVDVAQTRRTIESSEARVLTHVHTLCPYFDVLDPILKSDDAPPLSPPSTERKKALGQRRSDDENEDDENEDENDDENDDDDSPAAVAGTAAAAITTRSPAVADHRLLSGLLELDRARNRPSRKRQRERVDDTDDDHDDEDERQIARARRRVRDADDALFLKRQREQLLLNLELDNQVKKLQLERERLVLAKEFLLVRSQLRAAGVSQQEIDDGLPPRPSGAADATR